MWPTSDLPIKFWPFVLFSITAIQVITFVLLPNPRDAALDLDDTQPIQAITFLFTHANA